MVPRTLAPLPVKVLLVIKGAHTLRSTECSHATAASRRHCLPVSYHKKHPRYLLVSFPSSKQMETATHSSILAREIPWTEEPGRLQSPGSQKSCI